MDRPNPNWHFTTRVHPLEGAVLALAPCPSGNGSGLDRCVFCAAVLTDAASNSEPHVAFTDNNGHWVCLTCFCEHKDDFNWPSPE